MMKRNESGFTLVGVLAVFSILSVFGISLVMLSISSVKTSNNEHDDQSVFYIAEAGANYMANEIETKANEVYNDVSVSTPEEFYRKLSDKITSDEKVYNTFSPTERDEQPKAKITVEKNSDTSPAKYTITSIGTIGNQSRTVTQTVEVEWPNDEGDGGNGDGGTDSGLLPPFAVFAQNGKLELQKDITIIGNIGTNQTKDGSIEIQGNKVTLNGKIYIPENNESIIKYDYKKSEQIVVSDSPFYLPSLPVFPKFNDVSNKQKIKRDDSKTYTLKLTSNKEYEEIELQNNSTLKIDIGNHDRTLIVNKLDIHNGNIEISGTGTLNLYINKSSQIQGKDGIPSTMNKKGNITQLNIYTKDNFDMQEGSIIQGSMYIQNNELKMDDASELYGNIFIDGGKMDIQKKSIIHSEIILVANSNHKVKVDSSTIKGPIFAGEFDMQGGTLDHKPPFTLTGPLSFNNLGHVWPDKGQGTGGNGNEGGNSPKPDGGPSVSIPPIKEIPNN